MAEQNMEPAETGAEMDYGAHEKTYEGFLSMSRVGTFAILAVLLGMAVGFFTSAGFILSFLLTIILLILGFIYLR